MIWFFLAGMISGAVGTIMYARWWIEKHTTRITREELDKVMKHMEEKSDD